MPFKKAENTFSDNDLGQYFSALANEANLKGAEIAWLVFGVDNNTHHIIGTNYKPSRPSLDEMKKRIADQTTNRITFDEIYELCIEGHRVILFQIPAAPQGLPIAFKGHYYGRDNESLVALNLHEIELIRAQANYPQKALKDMSQEEKIQACYQHTCLLYEDGKELNNASLRKRFELDDKKSSVASRIIADTLEAGLIRMAKEDTQSRKFVTYVPFYG